MFKARFYKRVVHSAIGLSVLLWITACGGELEIEENTKLAGTGEESSETEANQNNCSQANLKLLGGGPTLLKASLALTGEVPSQNRLARADNNFNNIDAELDHLFRQDGFEAWLQDIFNDQILTDQFTSKNNDNKNQILAFVDEELYTTAKVHYIRESNPVWQFYAAVYGEEFMDIAREEVGNSLGREPMELIAYIVRNNRPFSEIITADYTVLNPYAAFAYGFDVIEEFGIHGYKDPNNWKKIRVEKHKRHDRNLQAWVVADPDSGHAEHAGILTTTAFLARHPTNDSNRNRTRAYIFMKYFLDWDVLELMAQTVSTDDLHVDEPWKNVGACASCHNFMDPIAQTWRNWATSSFYVRPSSAHYNPSMVPPGLLGPGYAGSSDYEEYFTPNHRVATKLRWMAEKAIAADSDSRINTYSFSRAIARTMFKALTGQKELSGTCQYRFFDTLAEHFRNSNYNLRTLLKEIIKSSYFRAQKIEVFYQNNLPQAQSRLASYGTRKLLTPEQLSRKIQGTLSDIIPRSRLTPITEKLDDRYKMRLAYGGMDSHNVTERLTEMNPVMANIQLDLAAELACEVVKSEFSKSQSQRKVLQYVDTEMELTNETLYQMLSGFVNFYRKIGIEPGDSVINPVYMWVLTPESRSRYAVPEECRPSDMGPKVLPWLAAYTLILSDFYFFYQ